jgi:hypothetical protein
VLRRPIEITAFTRPWRRHVYSNQLLLNLWQRLIIEARLGQASLISRRRPLATS